MKKTIAILSAIILGCIYINGQDVACTELMNYVVKNGTRSENVNQIQLMNSTWLKEVTKYSIDNTIAVIAEIKQDEFGIVTKKYIFCGIPSSNWSSFYFGFNDLDKTYGERFHKYIYDYKCECK
jgi:hypothetical protein